MTYIPKKRREESSTVHVGGKDKFPIDSARTAKSALKLENSAKPPLTVSQKAAVERKAAKFGATKSNSTPRSMAGSEESTSKKETSKKNKKS